MQHKFYSKSQKQQSRIQLLIGLAAFLVVLFLFMLSWLTGYYFLVVLVLPIVLSLIAPFFDTPSLVKSGSLSYHSLLFLSEKPTDNTIKIHGGTLLDYVFVINRKLNGRQRRDFIVQQYLEGLLNLMEENENKWPKGVKIKGTSYIINERTAQRIGFRPVKTDYLQKLLLTLNYFNVLTSYSIANAKLSFPKLGGTRSFEANLEELLERRELIKDLNGKLKGRIEKSQVAALVN
ncbi:hypothetical protein J0A67_03740 [Algoriphagus aestuariicola]|uniref:Uncharacterized protein n=1 Tax=Algoriphagus aestuariicola TaxID=1852016 RepID=A0ABS3BNX7_9BACT|nr:hypothetical protein [Algoriphagus aestuariicola]MBN7799956.1 hypothetical protein [Algoriphagus aestuariicola]